MTSNQKKCSLCNLVVAIESFTLSTKEGVKYFCCEGCKSIYRMLNYELILPDPDKKPEK
jgi:hypothetical protein